MIAMSRGGSETTLQCEVPQEVPTINTAMWSQNRRTWSSSGKNATRHRCVFGLFEVSEPTVYDTTVAPVDIAWGYYVSLG